jgi:hypothetical protein
MGCPSALRNGLIQLVNENDQQRTLERIEDRLNAIERNLRTSSDDSIFLALVFSLAIFLFTVPFNDLARFFQDFSRFTPESATSVTQVIKYACVFCLLVSSASRYYGSIIGRVRPSKAARAFSIECLILAWDAFLFAFVISGVFIILPILGGATIFISAVAALVVFIGMAWIENRVLRFYASRYMIRKKDVTPLISNLFQWFALSLYLAFLTVVTLFLITSTLSVVFNANFAFLTAVGWVLWFALLTQVTRDRRKRRRVNAWQSRGLLDRR